MITGARARKIALNSEGMIYDGELLVADNVSDTLQALNSIITSCAYDSAFSTQIRLSFKRLDGSLRPINSFEKEALVTSLKHYGFSVSCDAVRNFTHLTISW